jgi:hypothetical protein
VTAWDFQLLLLKMLKSKIALNVGFITPNHDITKNTKGRKRAEEQEEIKIYIFKDSCSFLNRGLLLHELAESR